MGIVHQFMSFSPDFWICQGCSVHGLEYHILPFTLLKSCVHYAVIIQYLEEELKRTDYQNVSKTPARVC